MTLHVLDILNFSNWRNPDADSGIRLNKELICAALRKRNDLFFHVLVPPEMPAWFRDDLPADRVRLLPVDLVSRQQGGAFHFNVRQLETCLDFRDLEIDVLFVNQPELTPAFLEFFNKVHFFDVHAFTYVHWMDWKRRDSAKNRWNRPTNLGTLQALLLSAVAGCNSSFGKARILEEASAWFRDEVVQQLDSRLIPMPPGIDAAEVRAARPQRTRVSGVKTIVFPYRPLWYTGFRSLVRTHLRQLWEKRRDFRVVATNPSAYPSVRRMTEHYPFLEFKPLDRQGYLRELWGADVVLGTHNGANQWSLAAVEALACECVPLFNQESFFPEMLLQCCPEREHQDLLDRFFYYRATFGERLSRLLDRIDREQAFVRLLGKRVRRHFDWKQRVTPWLEAIQLADAAAPQVTERSAVARRILKLIELNGGCSKRELLRYLGWHPKSRYIPWTRYRNFLRERTQEAVHNGVVTYLPKSR